MKQAFLLLALFAACFPASGQAHRPQVVAVAFYNFENLFDTHDDPRNPGDNEFLPSGPYRYTPEKYREKLRNLARVLGEMDMPGMPDGPALIGTAEIENAEVLRDLVLQPGIRERGYQFVHFDGPDPRGIDVALLYHPRYFRVLSSRALRVDLSRGRKKGGRTRDVLYVQGKLLGDTVHVFVNHWPSRRGGEQASAKLREQAAQVSKRIIDSLAVRNPATRIIVMGDLNDDPTDYSVSQVLGARGKASEVALAGMFNPFMSFYKRGIGTVAFDDRWNLFDQILVSGAFLQAGNKGLRFNKAEVFNKNFLKTPFGKYRGYPHRSFQGHRWMNGYSDHFPAIVYLTKG